MAGVEGNGQRTLVRALAGLVEIESGRIRLGDQDVAGLSTGERRARGLRVIPFERNSEGLSLSSSLWENWSARQLLRGSALRLISPARFRSECDRALKRWDVRYSTTLQPAGSLSGGNAQKLILAREVDDDAKLVIAAQPTRGLDVGATAFVWKSLRDATARGCGVLLISSDLDELFDISDRLVVMLSGRIAAEFRPPFRLERGRRSHDWSALRCGGISPQSLERSPSSSSRSPCAASSSNSPAIPPSRCSRASPTARSSIRTPGRAACVGRCRCSSQPAASSSRSAAAISMSAHKGSSISARSARPSWSISSTVILQPSLCRSPSWRRSCAARSGRRGPAISA